MFLRLVNAPDALLTVHEVVLDLPDFNVELDSLGGFVVWDEVTAAQLGHRINLHRDALTVIKLRKRRQLRSATAAPVTEEESEWVEAGPRRPVTRIVTSPLLVVAALDAERPYVSPFEVARLRPIYAGPRKVVDHVPEYVTPLDVVAIEHATYAVWHAVLAMLVTALAGLPGYEVTGPAAPAEPWAGERRVLRGQIVAPSLPSKTLKTRKKASLKAPKKGKL
ncbi:hypothetical protein AEGHOMDF_4511 [Methylobacterium soli]|nr:hypothetical protein AEGHOMDF_4511 [Methylobacterium soli]